MEIKNQGKNHKPKQEWEDIKKIQLAMACYIHKRVYKIIKRNILKQIETFMCIKYHCLW